MVVQHKPDSFDALQWNGEPHPRVSVCSCHPGKGVFQPGKNTEEFIEKGDWILTHTETKELRRVTNETFHREYEVVVIS